MIRTSYLSFLNTYNERLFGFHGVIPHHQNNAGNSWSYQKVGQRPTSAWIGIKTRLIIITGRVCNSNTDCPNEHMGRQSRLGSNLVGAEILNRTVRMSTGTASRGLNSKANRPNSHSDRQLHDTSAPLTAGQGINFSPSRLAVAHLSGQLQPKARQPCSHLSSLFQGGWLTSCAAMERSPRSLKNA